MINILKYVSHINNELVSKMSLHCNDVEVAHEVRNKNCDCQLHKNLQFRAAA